MKVKIYQNRMIKLFKKEENKLKYQHKLYLH